MRNVTMPSERFYLLNPLIISTSTWCHLKIGITVRSKLLLWLPAVQTRRVYRHCCSTRCCTVALVALHTLVEPVHVDEVLHVGSTSAIVLLKMIWNRCHCFVLKHEKQLQAGQDVQCKHVALFSVQSTDLKVVSHSTKNWLVPLTLLLEHLSKKGCQRWLIVSKLLPELAKLLLA